MTPLSISLGLACDGYKDGYNRDNTCVRGLAFAALCFFLTEGAAGAGVRVKSGTSLKIFLLLLCGEETPHRGHRRISCCLSRQLCLVGTRGHDHPWVASTMIEHRPLVEPKGGPIVQPWLPIHLFRPRTGVCFVVVDRRCFAALPSFPFCFT